jgi:hypothetical protein
MIKRFEQFLKINESLSFDVNNIEEEVYSNFYSLRGLNKSIHISRSNLFFIDDSGFLRYEIKISEQLTPSIFISVEFDLSEELKQESINEIKSIIKKIKLILKRKYRLDLETLIIDPNGFDIYEYEDVHDYILTDKKDPFNGINIKDNSLYYNDKKIYTLMILLKNSYKTTISGLDFAKFYELSDYFVKSDDLYVKIGFDELIEIFDPYSEDKNIREKIFDHIKSEINPNIYVDGNDLVIKFDPNILRDYDDPEVKYWGSSWSNDLNKSSLKNIVKEDLYNYPKLEM